MTTSTSFAQMANNQSISLSSALRANTPPTKGQTTSRKFLTLSIFFLLSFFCTTNLWGAEYETPFTITSDAVVSNSGYMKYTYTDDSSRGWIITYGGNNKSVGTNSNNRNSCKLTNYSKYAVSPVEKTSSIASAFVSTTSLTDIGKISYTFNGGSNQTSTRVYLIYSSDNNTFSQISLSPNTQGATISSGTSYTFAKKTGYFGLLFVATNSSGAWRIDDVNISFYKEKESTPSHTITATSNNNNYGTVSVSGTTITASPKTGYRVSTATPYTISPSGSATVNQDGQTFTVTPSENTTITINFEPIPTHQVYFNTGGLVDIESVDVQEGQTYNITQTPASSLTQECEYNTFVGWTKFNTIANPSSKPTIVNSIEMESSDITLYAVYSKTEGGGGSAAEQGTTMFSENWEGCTNNTQPTQPTSDGSVVYNAATITYEWKSSGSTSQTYTSGGPNSNENILISKINGYWKVVGIPTGQAETLTLSSSTSGSGVLSISTSTSNVSISGSTITIGSSSVNTFDLIFTNTNSSSNLRLDDISVVVAKAGATGSTTYSLTPQCTTETIVTFELNGGSGTFDYVTLNSNTYAIPGTEPTRNGYNFTGWKIQGGDETIYKYGTSNSNISNITESITLVAQWTANTYTVTLNANGGSGNTISVAATYDSSTLNPSSITNPIKTGHTFGGWYSGEGGTGSLVINSSGKLQANVSGFTGTNGVWKATTHKTLYAKWTPAVYTITYKDQGDVAFSGMHATGYPQEHTYGSVTTLKDPTKTGFDFAGWYNNQNCTDPALSELGATDYTQNITLYAKWTAKTITITWDANGGSVTPESSTYTYNGATITLPTPTRTGYSFNGWFTETTDGTKITEVGTTNKPTENVTYYAQWAKLHTITWNAAGETSTTTVVDGEHVELPISVPSSCSDKYTTFVGWYTAASGMETSPSATPQGEQVTASTIPTGNATYYAVWADAGDAEEVVDVLNRELTGVSGTSYSSWSDKTSNSSAVYKGQSAGGNDAIQLRSSNNNSGIVTTTSGGKATKVVVSWNSNTSDDRTLNVYGKNSAYEAATDLYDNSKQGTLLGIIVYGTSTEFTIEGEYEYIGMRSASGAMNLGEIQITWSAGSEPTGYISSCCQSPAVVIVTPDDESLELNIDGTASTTVNISQEGGGSGKYYEPTVSPADDGASLDWGALGVTFKQTAYDIDFTATKAGTYTVTGNFTETSYGCSKTGSATITVAANPILQVSAEELTFSPTCGQNTVSQEVEINSRYLTSDNITATVATTSGSGQFTISTDNTTFGTSKTLSGGITTKVTDQIYVRYEAIESETGNVAGTLTLTCGDEEKVITLSGACTCSANVTITGNPIQITAAEGVWVEAATVLTVAGTFLTTNADNANVSIRAYTNNAAFQIKKGGVTGEGAPKTASDNALTLNTDGAISTADWTGNIGIVYKPTQANTTETATLTVEVYRHNGTTVYSTATYKLEGRSLPEQFVIAVTNGSGDWFAVPADMVAPWGNACSGLGTFAPYPISVDNTTAPTEARDVPARAVYQAAARTGNVNTNPQTMSYKSVPLGGNYYLYGSSTNVDSDGSNTNIQNASFAASEKQKWFLDVVNWNTKQYNMHVHSSLTTNVLAYTTAGGANRVGQYSATAGTTKKSIYLLPINGTTCTYYAAPVVTVTAIDATNATIQFKNDRTTAYEISLDQNTWTDLPVTLIKDCNNSEEATQLQAQLPLDTYRGQTVYIRAKVTTGTACQETGSFVVPNPTIDRGETPWEYTGTAGQAFSNNSKSITISDLWNPLSVSVAQQVTGSNIQASITPEGVVTVSMAAEDATEGVHQAILQFISDGASFVDNGKGNPQYVGVVITLHSLAEMNFDGGNGAFEKVNGTTMLCKEAIDGGITPKIYLNDALCLNGNYISTTEELNQTTFSLVDLNSGASLSFERDGTNGGTGGGIASVTFNASTIAAMIPGHTYRLSWENTNQVMTNAVGLPYMDCYMDFVYSENCDAPTALAACPITQTSFTANWAPVADCTGDVTVDVYTKSEGKEMWSIDYTQTPTLNVWTFAGLSQMQEEGGWYCANTSNSAQISYTSAGIQISKASTYGQLYSPTFANMSNVPNDLANTEVTISITHISASDGTYKFRIYAVETTDAKANVPYAKNKMYDVYFNGSNTKSSYLELTGGNTETTSTITIKGLTSTSHILLYGNQSTKTGPRIKQFVIKNASSNNSVDTKTASCSTGSAEFTDLSANTTYYYTVTDGSSNTSNEIAVTTYNGEPELKFYSDEACTTEITETTVLGGEETTVYVKGTRVPACAINASVSTGYGMDDSGINYTTGTGVVSGSIILTLADANTTEGTLTITDAEGNNVLNIVSSDCPAGFGTMALPADNITPNTAQANWRNTTLDFGDDKSGTLQLYKNGIVNRELIVNGDFETGSLAEGWSNGINKGEVGAAHSFEQYTIKNSSSEAYDGNYSLYVTADNNSTLTNFHYQSVMYADYITLTPGTYSMSAWVKMPTADGRDDKTQLFSLGIITEENGSQHVYTVSTPVTVYSNNTYVKLTHEFEVTSTITKACPAIGASSGIFRFFYLDDVSLKCTSIGQGEEPYLSIDIADLSADGNIALTGLSGNTEYTYIIQNADGCSSNPITFQTTDAGAPQLSVTTPVSIAAPLGGSAKGVATVTATDAYSTINVTLAYNEQRIRLNATTIPAAGGVVQFTFTPLNTDDPRTTGTSIVTLTTQGMANPVELTINWAVTSGIDVNTPMVEVTEISNEQITIEHNVDLENELDVRIIMNRPITDDEKEENVGDEIFFSKYYEAYMHKKLWAIFNPTAQKRSLAGMQVWRSKSNYEDWNTAPENIIDLSEMGNYEKGWIYPNEEIIVYTADQVGECERSKTDMSNWVAMSSSNLPVSFSGDDALLLVRKVSAVEQAKNNIPPTTSISTDTNGDPISISWRIYTDSVSQEWYMLDLIGARTDQNKPDGSATRSWSWTDCSTTPAKTEAGDAKGWVGYGYDLADNKIKYNSCEGEGYILSTNRCLLIRRMNVKSGANAVATNIGDMVTLNSEWKGSHVPKDGDQAQTSCENFSYVGGYDYDGYYNAWVPLDGEEFVYASQNEDGTYTFDMDVPHYYCDTMRIEVVEKVTVNGVESDNIHAYNLYKVPIVVDVDADTDDEKFFHYPERPSDDLNTPITGEKELTTTICETCDVVIRDEAQLTHVEGGQGQFRNIMVYPGAKLNNTNGQAFRLQGLHIQALNDTVGYAIINNDQSSIEVDTIIHTKRINDQYWYIFSLPYDCNVAAIRQLNGKSMGDYGFDWGIQYYDGKARQETGTSAAPGAVSEFWKRVEASDTLKANEAYIIGLFTTQWTNQHKTIYFPPTESTQYTESGNEAKETNVYNWNVNLAAEKRHHGWNFVGSPYISIFDPNGQTDAGVNNGNVVIKGEIQADGSYTNDTEVFVSIPDGSNARTYTQQRAASTKLEPFKGYFIQVVDPTSGEDETKTLQYSKTGRTLSNNAPARKAQAAREKVVVELELVAFDNQVDYAGVLVDDNYKPEYEISGDLVKMYAAASKPQLYLRDMTNEQMAYIALPDANAENIPLEFYAHKEGNYTLAMNQLKSRIHGAKTIELLYNGEVVANLMFDTYTIAAQKGVNKGYSIRIQRVAQVITSIDNVSMEGITIATTEGYITIEGLPTGAQVMLYDMVGKLIKADYEMNGIVNFDAPTQGVYEISIQTAQGNNCVKTIIR